MRIKLTSSEFALTFNKWMDKRDVPEKFSINRIRAQNKLKRFLTRLLYGKPKPMIGW